MGANQPKFNNAQNYASIGFGLHPFQCFVMIFCIINSNALLVLSILHLCTDLTSYEGAPALKQLGV